MATPPADELRPRPPFDEALQEAFRQLSFHSFLEYPELRSVVVVFDYAGELNEAPIRKGFWVGPHGKVQDYAALVGSFRQTLAMLKLQMAELEALGHSLDQACYQAALSARQRGSTSAPIADSAR